MKLQLDSALFESYSDIKIGLFLMRGINNERRISDIESLLRGISAQRRRQFETEIPANNDLIKVWDQTYGRFGVNPHKYPNPLMQLLEILKTGEIPHVDALTDLCNYYSLKQLLPITSLDIDWLYGDLQLTYTKGEEAFRAKNTIDVERALEGEVAYKDQGGIIRRYWNHKNCERTKPRKKTSNAIILIEDISRMHMDEFGGYMKEVQKGIIKYIGGMIEPHILTEENPSADLQVDGRMHANDSKIPQQEKIHFQQQH